MKIKKETKGYILLELIIAITVSIIALFLLVVVLKNTQNINCYYNDKIEIQENAKNIEDTMKIKLGNIKKAPRYEVGDGEIDSEKFKSAKGIFYHKMQIVNGKIICYNKEKEDKELKIQNNKMYIVNIDGGNNTKYQIGCYIEELRILKYKNKDYFYIKLIMKKGDANYTRKFKIYCK